MICTLITSLSLNAEIARSQTHALLSKNDQGSQHQYFKQLDNALVRLVELGEHHPQVSALLKLATGNDFSNTAAHYRGLMTDLAKVINKHSNISTENKQIDDTGSGANGYYAAQYLFDQGTYSKIGKFYLSASNSIISKPNIHWTEWIKNFKQPSPDENALLAIKSIISSLHYVRETLPDYPKSLIEIQTRFNGVIKTDSYAVGAFHGMKFDLDLRDYRDFSNNPMAWGRAYKTIAGMNLGLYLFLMGYSTSDLEFMISRSSIAYEASDFLYDHLGRTRAGVFQARDKPQSGLSGIYSNITKKISNMINQDLRLNRKLIGSVYGVSAIAVLIPDAEKQMDLKDEFNLALMLLTMRYEHKAEFEKYFARFFSDEGERGKEILKLIDQGVADIKTTQQGAEFISLKLKSYPRKTIKPDGAIRKLEKIDNLLKYFPGLK